MRLHEALRLSETKEYVWFRPVTWRARGEAFAVNTSGNLIIVPTFEGGHVTALSAEDAAGHWEVVFPNEGLVIPKDMHHTYVSATDHERWEMFGLPDMDEIMDECETCRVKEWGDETTSGFWYWSDDGLMAIATGTWANDNAPGASGYSCALLYHSRQKYEEALAKWDAEPRELEAGV